MGLPLGMLLLFERYVDIKNAFMSVFLFMGITTFFTEVPSIGKQMVAEVILIALFIGMVKGWRWYWLALLAIGVAISHYALAWVLAIILAVVLIVQICYQKWRKLAQIGVVMAILCVFSYVYFANVAGGTCLDRFYLALGRENNTAVAAITNSGSDNSSPAETVKIDMRDGLVKTMVGADFNQTDLQGKAGRILVFAIEGLLVTGYIFLMRRKDVDTVFKGIISGSLVILIVCVWHPSFAGLLNMTRFLHICLITLSLAGIYAAIKIFKYKVLILSMVCALFIFTSGFVFEATKVTDLTNITLPYSIGMSAWRTDVGGVLTNNDAALADWCIENDIRPIYADMNSFLLLQ